MLDETHLNRFMGYVRVSPMGGCWHWTGGSGGRRGRMERYGRFSIDRKKHLSHRVAYEHWVGPIPDGLELDHLCRTTDCVNPWHLEPVTHRENMRRGAWAMKTHCPNGHPYAGKNLAVTPAGVRHCRKCRATAERERYRRKQVSPV